MSDVTSENVSAQDNIISLWRLFTPFSDRQQKADHLHLMLN